MDLYVLIIKQNGWVIMNVASQTEKKLIPTLSSFVTAYDINNVDLDGDFDQILIDIEENIGGRGFEIEVHTMELV